MRIVPRCWMVLNTTGVLAVLIICMATFACSASNVERTDTFRGLKWGNPLDDSSRYELLAQEGDLKFYKKKNEELKVNDVAVESIVYGFHKDRFYNVMIYFKSLENFNRLKEILTQQYGPPLEPDQTAKKCFWNLDPVNLLLDYAEGAGTGRISYFYKPIQTEIEMN